MSMSPVASRRGVEQVDVAKLAGVSQKTVSRVVNNSPHVRPDMRARVLTAIDQLGYRPNVAAQSLARNRTHIIGMLVVATTLHGPAHKVFSIEHAARRHGYALAIASLPDLDQRTIGEAVGDLLNRRVEGLIVEIPSRAIPVDLTGFGDLPVVKSGDTIAGVRRQVLVDTDQFGAARDVTDHLLSLGHDTVWHVAGPRDWDAARSRTQGWRSALRAAHRRVPRVLYGDWSARSGYIQGRKLAERDDVTAIFVANDHMAMGLMRAFAEVGRQVPRDVSVIGFDDVPEAEFQIVPLSTVTVDFDEAAERALAELVSMIEGAEPAEPEIRFRASLTLRSSSGPPAAGPDLSTTTQARSRTPGGQPSPVRVQLQ